ncbi:hypothetical protein DL95DRAFT_467100 [Leptodontidium sp. 2 PMI_412]|nr:hypothetical protein DL95DRAFT_467100 [Leptodontidium sp. 2 PMI_412]
MRHAYLVYIYAASLSSSASKRCDIRTASKEGLRYAVRWMIFIDALGLGAVLVCGEAIARLVYKTSGNTNDDLKWLATRVRQYRIIDFRALCGIFHIVMADLLQHYQVKHPLGKFDLVAKIQTVTDGSASEGCITAQSELNSYHRQSIACAWRISSRYGIEVVPVGVEGRAMSKGN